MNDDIPISLFLYNWQDKGLWHEKLKNMVYNDGISLPSYHHCNRIIHLPSYLLFSCFSIFRLQKGKKYHNSLVNFHWTSNQVNKHKIIKKMVATNLIHVNESKFHQLFTNYILAIISSYHYIEQHIFEQTSLLF